MYKDIKDLLKGIGTFLGLTISMAAWSGWILYNCNKPWEKLKELKGIEKVVEEKPLTFEEYKKSLKDYKPKFPKINNYKFEKKVIKYYTLEEITKNGKI